MRDKFIKITAVTIVMLIGWMVYEFYTNKFLVENAENIEVLDPKINTDILNDVKSKYYF